VIQSRRTPVHALAKLVSIGALAVLGVSACTSDPSPTRVAQDLVRTVAQDHPEIRDCMLGVIDDYDLDKLGEDAISENPDKSGPALKELESFETDLAACDPDGVTRTSTP
jgi:hypothetical protein